MAEEVKVWYDKEGDYLEVLFDRKAGYFRETENDSVMEKVDTDGPALSGFISPSCKKSSSPFRPK